MLNDGNLDLTDIFNVLYHILQYTSQSHVGLARLKNVNDLIGNVPVCLFLFYYSLNLNILYGEKYEVEHLTIKARNSKKYFKKGNIHFTI